MIRIKSCPKCQGDCLIDRDTYGWYEQCLQCGYLRDLGNIAKKEGVKSGKEADDADEKKN